MGCRQMVKFNLLPAVGQDRETIASLSGPYDFYVPDKPSKSATPE